MWHKSAWVDTPLEFILGDIDTTGTVDFDDLLAVLSVWGECPARCDEDLDADGQVGFTDLLLVLSFWGSCSE